MERVYSYFLLLLCSNITIVVFNAILFCFFKQKTPYDMRISDWSSDVCSSDLARRVWAFSSIHGEVAALNRLHRAMIPRLEPGDCLVYLGNLIGRSTGATATLDSLLRFRSLFLARPDAFACDVVHLRGSQEEMWQKLLQLQFATDPRAVLQWLPDQP